MDQPTSKIDQRNARLDAMSTQSQHALSTFTALSLMLLIASSHSEAAAPLVAEPSSAVFRANAGTAQQTREVVPATSSELLAELMRFHRRLVDSQTELSGAAMQVLASNLWALYE